MRPRAQRQVQVGQQSGETGGDAPGEEPEPPQDRGLRGDGEKADGDADDSHLEMIRRAEAADEGGQDEVAVPAAAVPPKREEKRERDEERVQRIDPLDVGLGPEAGREREEPGRSRRGRAVDTGLAARRVHHGARRRGADGGEEAEAPRQRQESEEHRPELSGEHVERVAGRVRDSHHRDRREEVPAVADVDRPACAGDVDGEGHRGDAEGPPGFAAGGGAHGGRPRVKGRAALRGA